MAASKRFSKIKPSSCLFNCIIIVSSSISLIYILVSIFLVHSYNPDNLFPARNPTTVDHLVFGIASSANTWPKRKEYVKLWWQPDRMRGCVFLESKPESNQTDSSIPSVCVSDDISRFRYSYKGGYRSAIRVARVFKETVLLNHSNVRWFVFGDDDTVFLPENLVKTLRKYDHGLWYYIGGNSEMYVQNQFFSFDMAFGGGGFAVSASLAEVLAESFDSCIERYPHLYGSDARICSCMEELGVGLTREPGFHQIDVKGNAFGLLASHPTTPLVSLHHLESIDPIFPNMTAPKSIQHLFKAADVDSQRMLQQTVCYDPWFSWTISVSWGYAVQVHGKKVLLPDILPVEETFKKWMPKDKNVVSGLYNFNTRKQHPNPCQRPTVFFLDSVSSGWNGVHSVYKKSYANCSYDKSSPRKLDEIRVFSQKLDLDSKQIRAPRRHCCDVLPSTRDQFMDISIRECKKDELTYMHG